jgi:hypothetical protein
MHLNKHAKYLKRQLLQSALLKVSKEEESLVIWTTLRKLVIGNASSLDPHFVTEVMQAINARNVDGLLMITAKAADPQLYRSAEAYMPHAVIAAFLRKYPFKEVPGLNPRQVALDRSARAERLCRITNRRLRFYRGREYRLPQKRRYLSWVFHSAREKISRWLGPVTVGLVADRARHGPGGCLGVKRPKTTKYYKYASESYSMTARCAPYARALFETNPIWVRSLSGLSPFDEGPPMSVEMISRYVRITDYNKVTYVPKTARTDRAIAVEPLLNIFFQLGVGSVLRDSLRKAGLDLDHCWERNISLARSGSLSDQLSTVDLSMASDTLSIELVRELLPPDWFDLLSDFRSPKGSFDGDGLMDWAKFSSMGNGYTFELESLIFYALTLSVCEYQKIDTADVSVFGDDIIIPSTCFDRLLDTLRFSGFVLNREKSFVKGPFRESCGGDFFQGVDVRPVYLKNKLRTRQDLIFLRNSLFLLKDRVLFPEVVQDVVEFIDSRLPTVLTTHLLGPISGPIDGTIYTDWDGAHRSALVMWDRDLHEMRYPALSQVVRPIRGCSTFFVYLQFMEGTGLQVVPSDEEITTPPWAELSPTASSRSIVTWTQSGVTQLQLRVAYHWHR